MPIIFPLFGYDYLAQALHQSAAYTLGEIQIHDFPDQESLVQLITPVQGEEVVFIASLDQPNPKIIPLLFAAATAKSLGATRVGLIAPYLAYMRQDKQFHPGEGITSSFFARIISQHFDWLLTVDPHLHRWHDLNELYTIPAKTVHATGPISDWIREKIKNPLIIGPDSESKQWVSEIATLCNAPYLVFAKHRINDTTVEVFSKNLEAYPDHTPVLVDDIISTGSTFIQAIEQVKKSGMRDPICIGVHALFAGNAYQRLLEAGPAEVVTCNTVKHPSNGIDISMVLIKGHGLKMK
jgi:ribose-phosphate pyrophosphokinase